MIRNVSRVRKGDRNDVVASWRVDWISHLHGQTRVPRVVAQHVNDSQPKRRLRVRFFQEDEEKMVESG